MKVIVITVLLLSLTVVFAQPSGAGDLQVTINTSTTNLFAGETVSINIKLKNIGSEEIKDFDAWFINVETPVNFIESTISTDIHCGDNNPNLGHQIVCALEDVETFAVGEERNVTLRITPASSNNHDEYVIDIDALSTSFSNDINPDNDFAQTSILVTSQPTIGQYAQALISALGASGPRLNQVVASLSAYCALDDKFFIGLGGNCDDLYQEALNGNGEVVELVLRRLRPREIVQQAKTSAEIISTQQANIGSRMSQLRFGVTNALSGLNISQNGKNISMGMLSYLANSDTNNSSAEYISPWGVFVNGRISAGDYTYADARNEGFDFDSDGLTAGIDYRFNNKLVAGLALGYANFDSNVGSDIIMSSESLSYSAYGSYNPTDNFYIDARMSYAKPEFDQQRSVQFSLINNQIDELLNGKTNGTQKSIIISSGYQYFHNSWRFTPTISIERSDTQIDAFVETGAAAFNVGFSEQNFETTRASLGFNLSNSISLASGVLIPSFGYQLIHENQGGDEFVFMRVSGMPAGEFFNASTEFNDNDYSTINLGLTFVSSGGKQAYIRYTKTLGWDGFDRYVFNLGARFEF